MKPTTVSQNFDDSTLHGSVMPADGAAAAMPFVPRTTLFDACHVGVVLRVVLLVEAVTGVGAMFETADPLDWLLRFSLLTGGVLPATLSWLIAVCAFKGRLNRLDVSLQWLAGTVMGAVAGVYGCGLLALMGLLLPAPWWASGASGVLLSALVLAGLFWRAKARTPAATAARLAELQSRIRPHFLFNSFNAAISLVRKDPKRAERVLEDLSDIFRMLMRDSRSLITLEEEIELAKQYLAIEQVRLGDRLETVWDIQRLPTKHKVPPLLLQPLLENAVQHGIEPNTEPGQVRIRITGMARELVIVVENTYRPGAVVPGNGIALGNIRERLRLVFDLEAKLTAAGDGSQFRVVITLPISAAAPS